MQNNKKNEIGKKALLTSDNWFFAPDGQQYRAAFGTVHEISNIEDMLGIKVNSRSRDWYIQIGNLSLAGCQIHHIIRTDTCSFGPSSRDLDDGLKSAVVECQTRIYNADKGHDPDTII